MRRLRSLLLRQLLPLLPRAELPHPPRHSASNRLLDEINRNLLYPRGPSLLRQHGCKWMRAGFAELLRSCHTLTTALRKTPDKRRPPLRSRGRRLQ